MVEGKTFNLLALVPYVRTDVEIFGRLDRSVTQVDLGSGSLMIYAGSTFAQSTAILEIDLNDLKKMDRRLQENEILKKLTGEQAKSRQAKIELGSTGLLGSGLAGSSSKPMLLKW